ncbi:hypothetical protein BJY04DRAFT_176363 [Aspergillus karnatakaensis]|uniref:uncharacterized protein n=1 Tax=Aspergillus karnatakaensis TaxID=1810916 RepID=UPI003CCE31C3
MPAVQMDALAAFSYLSDNLPTWMTRLSDLSAHTTAKNAEFAEAFRKHSSAPLRIRKRRNSSVCSIQTSSYGHGGTGSGSNSYTGRRRRGGDDSSLDSSDGPAVISTRHNLIIHYDGYTQKTLEELVRNIGTARNNLRKGKMSQLPIANGIRPPPPRSSARDLLESMEPDDLLAGIRSARARGPRQPSPQPRQPEKPARQSPFDIADKNLELAHSFCETAAYHFLRAGGCASELQSVKDRFTALLKIANEEVQQLRQEKKDESSEDEAESAMQATGPVSLKRPASSEGPIEVDDEQGSVEEIDLAAFRVGRMRR